MTPPNLIDEALNDSHGALKLGLVKIDWEEDLTEEILAELIADVIHEVAVVEVYWEDHGIGGYEYGSINIVDVNWGVTIDEDSHAVLYIPDAPAWLKLPETIETTESGDGYCGRYHQCSHSWSADVAWTVDVPEWRDNKLYVVYYGANA